MNPLPGYCRIHLKTIRISWFVNHLLPFRVFANRQQTEGGKTKNGRLTVVDNRIWSHYDEEVFLYECSYGEQTGRY
jgi:hypothetical protein